MDGWRTQRRCDRQTDPFLLLIVDFLFYFGGSKLLQVGSCEKQCLRGRLVHKGWARRPI